MTAVYETDLGDLPLVSRGKVRDIYDLGDSLLMVASDRISAFDVVMAEPVPDKGRVLTALSLFWFDLLGDVVEHHLLTAEVDQFPAECRPYRDQLAGRSMIVKKAEPLPVECIVRGYLSGSGWKDYLTTGEVCGYKLPMGLQESVRLDQPLFTPSTKAELGRHDLNITPEEAARLVGGEVAREAKRISLELYTRARDYAADRGIIIADTKFELGMQGGRLILIDEVLTPDSSRFWPADMYQVGQGQPSFDKQYLRDYLETLDWGKAPPPPPLPREVIHNTRAKYLDALEKLTGRGLD
ncbi:MAG: phosphoribosylaminoimidazolesuccinocarboxamide synthase [Proteobacteria bacterium]|nr:phosphoribosylaminoimidazolesuccinocarboxamide synthase [Pseudomonadota bacterium]